MLEIPVLFLSTGAWTAIGVLVAFTVVGLAALAGTSTEPREDEGMTRYVFGLGKIPRLRELPENRNLPATPKPLEAAGLRTVGKKADSVTGFTTSRYSLISGIRRPWELSDDLPDTVETIEIDREGGGHIWVSADGDVAARPKLTEEETEGLEEVLREVIDPPELRADRRTWAFSAESPEAVNAERV